MTTPVLRTMNPAPREVLDTHTGLYERMKYPPDFVKRFYARFFTAETIEALNDEPDKLSWWLQMFAPSHDEDEFLKLVSQPLFGAPTYQVSADIIKAVTELYVETASRLVHLEAADLPSESGFAWFDYPVVLRDVGGACLATRALSWGPQYITEEFLEGMWPPPENDVSRAGIRVSSWAHAEDVDDFTDERQAQILLAGNMPLSLSHSAFLPFGTRLRPRELGEIDSDDMHRWAHVLWMFMTTEIVMTAQPPVERHARRRAERSIKTATVNVVTLRRVRIGNAEVGHRDVDWSCRWVVQAHWRHLEDYAPAHQPHQARVKPGDAGHCTVCDARVTYIRAYVKGPEGQPLKPVPETLYKVAR